LRARAGLDKNSIVRTFKYLLESRDLQFEDEEAIEEALYHFEDGAAEFADCLMIARYRRLGCGAMLTFDTKAARLPGAEILSS
jgi:predicted nucleic-acid-binding protein